MTAFASVKITGGLLPAELLDAVFSADPRLPGTTPESYGLEHGESVRRQASRSWLYLLEVWREFQARIGADVGADGSDGVSARVTRERWLHILLRELGFRPAAAEGTFETDDKNFPVSHRSNDVPIHLLGYRTNLDHRTPKVTARAPQAMLQELLNISERYLWALLSNGGTLRLLRDSATLTGSAYVEFDLDMMFGGELFSDFVLLYLICHETRFTPHGDGGPQSCYLEQWRVAFAELGERALDQLRLGVQQAISALGTGFLSHPANAQLRARLSPDSADLRLGDLNRALLRIIYRLLFWFVAEERAALLQPDPADADPAIRKRFAEARNRYAAYFAAARLRRLALRHRGDRHDDLWEATRLVFDALGSEGGMPELALPGIGGIFESTADNGQALPLDEPLAGARLSNQALLGAVRALSVVTSRSGGGRRRVDFGNLGAEELGSVYESLLELIPNYDAEQLSYTLETLPGNERKESGSYYTPTPLVECLLDSALDPLLDRACDRPAADRIEALLDITVCDPACGSGHFLVAAARRIAKRVAAQETGEPEPPEPAVRAALRRVVGRCIYGVDINPMAAELAKVSLWLEALEQGKPLSFLDENIRIGNALLGVTPALLEQGLPDDALAPIEGDDRATATALRKQNIKELAGQYDLFSPNGIPVSNAVLAARAAAITRTLPGNLEDLHIRQQRLATELAASAELRQQKLLADAWCAAFVQPKTPETRQSAITHATIEQLASDHDQTLDQAATEDLIDRLTRQYRFFHWHVEFPHIFRVGNGTTTDPATGWSGGFTCVIGNPPWEHVELKEEEFFASRSPDIANAPNAAARKKMISQLAESDNPAERALFRDFLAELRQTAGWRHLLSASGRFPNTARGRINTYAVFAETGRTVISPAGRAGLVLPTGIATDAMTAPFFSSLVRSNNLVSFLDFENEAFLLSRAVHHDRPFCLLTLSGPSSEVRRVTFAFGTRYMRDLPDRRFTMPLEEILLVNPNTGTTPVFRSRRDAEITIGIYKRVSVLWRDDPQDNQWGLSFMQGLYNMASDSGLFRTLEDLESGGWMLNGNVFVKNGQRMLPLYEGKMAHHFDHRYGTYEGQTEAQANMGTLPRLTPGQQNDPDFVIQPRYWVQEYDSLDPIRSKPNKPVYNIGVTSRLATRSWQQEWLLGWRDITNAKNERTMICDVIPVVAVSHKFPLCFTHLHPELLLANLSSFVLDYTVRQKIAGTSMTYFVVKQLPVLTPSSYSEPVAWLTDATPDGWVRERVLELSYTAWDMEPFARDLGDEGAPFRWDEERRTAMRAELDAAFFHLYGLERDEVEHVMESFDALRRREEKQLGEFRTKRLILERYDAIADAARTGTAYQTKLDPAPGHGPRHPAR